MREQENKEVMKKRYDQGSKVVKFEGGGMVAVRMVHLHDKLQDTWKDPLPG